MNLVGDVKTEKDPQEIKDFLGGILEIDQKIKELKMERAELIEEMVQYDRGFRYESDNLISYFSKGKKFKANNNEIFDLYSIHPDIRMMLSSNCFLPGKVKKEEGLQGMWIEEETDRLELKKVNPDFIPKK